MYYFNVNLSAAEHPTASQSQRGSLSEGVDSTAVAVLGWQASGEQIAG